MTNLQEHPLVVHVDPFPTTVLVTTLVRALLTAALMTLMHLSLLLREQQTLEAIHDYLDSAIASGRCRTGLKGWLISSSSISLHFDPFLHPFFLTLLYLH